MDKYEFSINYKHEEYYWWFMGRRRIIKILLNKYLKDRQNRLFLDVACGTGIVLKDLSCFGKPVGIDLSLEALNFCRKRKVDNLLQCNISYPMPFKDKSFDFVSILGALNIKGVVSEVGVLKEIYRILKKDGIIISSEGAFNVLMSKHNKRIGAVKRYRKNEIGQMVEKAGFKILKVSYWNMFLFPIFLGAKLCDSLVPLPNRGFANMELPIPNFLNKFFAQILYIEAHLLKFVNFPLGTSIVTVGQK